MKWIHLQSTFSLHCNRNIFLSLCYVQNLDTLRDTEKALYFCNAHPNLFSQQNCNRCSRWMCHTCVHNNSTICADCLNSSFLGSETHATKEQSKHILISGLITLTIFLVINYFDKNGFEIDSAFYFNSLIAFLFGLSITCTHCMMRDTDFMEEIRKIPFIGFKLALFILLLIFISGIPILYFLYKLFKVKRSKFKEIRR